MCAVYNLGKIVKPFRNLVETVISSCHLHVFFLIVGHDYVSTDLQRRYTKHACDIVVIALSLLIADHKYCFPVYFFKTKYFVNFFFFYLMAYAQ